MGADFSRVRFNPCSIMQASSSSKAVSCSTPTPTSGRRLPTADCARSPFVIVPGLSGREHSR